MLQEMIIKDFEDIERFAEVNQKELDDIGQKGEAVRKARTIIHDDKYICLYQSAYNKFDYFSYTPELYNYLATPPKCSFKINKEGRTQIDLRQYYRAGHRCISTVNRFAYFYNEYCNKAGMPIEQFEKEFKAISVKAYEDGWEVDHANDNKDNNCHWGLSLVNSRKNGNGGKGQLLSNIKPPYYCFIIVMPEGDYRVEFGYIAPMEITKEVIGQQWFIHCQTIDELNSFLGSLYRDFIAMDKLPPYLSRWGNPQYLRATLKDQKLYFAGSFENEARAAERMFAVGPEQLVEWDGNMEWISQLP